MIVRRLTDFSTVEQLYNTRMKKDFPRDELKPLAMMRHFWEKDRYDCYGLFDGEEILGYAFFVRREGDYLFDYFAIAQEHRNEGLGTLFLQQLSGYLQGANCIVVEVEEPKRAENEADRALRERRLQFYLRSSYRLTELTCKVFGVEYRILEVPTAAAHTTDELRAVYTGLYRSMLPAVLFHTQVRML